MPGDHCPGQAGARQDAGASPEIAEAHGIPERYLVQILIHLKGAGLVYSTRGSRGGTGSPVRPSRSRSARS